MGPPRPPVVSMFSVSLGIRGQIVDAPPTTGVVSWGSEGPGKTAKVNMVAPFPRPLLLFSLFFLLPWKHHNPPFFCSEFLLIFLMTQCFFVSILVLFSFRGRAVSLSREGGSARCKAHWLSGGVL